MANLEQTRLLKIHTESKIHMPMEIKLKKEIECRKWSRDNGVAENIANFTGNWIMGAEINEMNNQWKDFKHIVYIAMPKKER